MLRAGGGDICAYCQHLDVLQLLLLSFLLEHLDVLRREVTDDGASTTASILNFWNHEFKFLEPRKAVRGSLSKGTVRPVLVQ